MKIKNIFNIDIRKICKDEFFKYTTESPIENKNKILTYLKNFDDCAFTSQPVYDMYTGKMVIDADNGKTDGVYTWYRSEIYYFEKYNLKLNDDFIQYVTSILDVT